MAIGKDGAALRGLRTLFDAGSLRDLTDGQLLERFATGRGEAAELAFSTLVERHGPMVLRVCRGELADPHDTHDAFQATFLVLVRKARGLWVRDSLGPWLHQVARRTARSARSAAARRRRHERGAAASRPEGRAEGADDLARALHDEIGRLHERDRAPVVLCDLEGRTHEQAARHLGWPIGTVKSRLTRARVRLRDRLARRGLAPGGLLLAAPPVPPALLDATTRAVVRFLTSRAIARGPVASLARGVIRSMILLRCAKVASVCLALGASAAGIEALAHRREPGKKAPGDDTPVAEVASGKRDLTVVERGSVEAIRALDVASGVEGTTKILSILPEGSRVKGGDVVAQLDVTALKDRLGRQTILAAQAESDFKQASLAHEMAQLAIKEYDDGFFRGEKETVHSELDQASDAVATCEKRLERTRRALERLRELQAAGGPRTGAELVTLLEFEERIDAAVQGLARAKAGLDLARAKVDNYQRFTRVRMKMVLENDLARTKLEGRSRERAWMLEHDKEEKLNRQVEGGVLRAPVDGLVTHANGPRPGLILIEEGAPVRERQVLFRVTDLDGPMRVDAKVHEAMVDRVEPGMLVRVTVDALPDKVMTGRVSRVAPRPDPAARATDRKVYATQVVIDGLHPYLRPGMTAGVEIVIGKLDGVLSVPVAAVAYFDEKEQVAVRKPGGGFEWREVKVGATDGKIVEIKAGLLGAGDAVSLDPQALMTEEQKRAKPRPGTARPGR